MKTKQFASKSEVVELLKQGWVIYNRKNESFGAKGQLVYKSWTWRVSNDVESKSVHHATIESLKKGGIISNERPYAYLSI